MALVRFGDAPLWYLQQLSQDRAWQRAWQERGNGSQQIPEEALLDMIFAEQETDGETAWPAYIVELRESL